MANGILNDRRLVVPEAVLPSQFEAIWTRRTATPEIALLHALLEQAARDLRRSPNKRLRGARRLHRDAYNWISSTDRSHPFSFLNVCDTLGLPANRVRARFLSGCDEEEQEARPAA